VGCIKGLNWAPARSLQKALIEVKREHVSRVLQRTGGSQKEAAKILQIQPPNLNRLMQQAEN